MQFCLRAWFVAGVIGEVCFNFTEMSLFKSVALIGKYKSPEIAEPLLKLASFLAQRGVSVKLDTLTAEHIGHNEHAVASLDEIGATCELAVVIGGDGTMLNIARTFAPYDVALVGVNQGRLGFLTDLSMETMTESWKKRNMSD